MARADRKPLYAHHVKVLHDFLYPILVLNWADPTFKAYKTSRPGKVLHSHLKRPKSDEILLTQLTAEDFKEYYLL